MTAAILPLCLLLLCASSLIHVTRSNGIAIALVDDENVPLYAKLDTQMLNKNLVSFVQNLTTETVRQIVKQEINAFTGNLINSSRTTALETRGRKEDTNQTDWIPVFVACPGNKRSVYRSWMAPSQMNDPLEVSPHICEKAHQRRSIIDHWNYNGKHIEQVKVELYKGRYVEASFLFDGKGSTRTDWFSKERLLQSTYADLSRSSTTNLFSMKGDVAHDRSFAINKLYNSCPGDIGWLMVIDNRYNSKSVCKFDRLYGHEYPYFIYANYNRAGLLENLEDTGLADLFVVSVKVANL